MILRTVQETSRQTSLSQMTIRRAVARGDLEHVRVGRRLLVPADALAEFIRARRRRGTR